MLTRYVGIMYRYLKNGYFLCDLTRITLENLNLVFSLLMEVPCISILRVSDNSTARARLAVQGKWSKKHKYASEWDIQTKLATYVSFNAQSDGGRGVILMACGVS